MNPQAPACRVFGLPVGFRTVVVLGLLAAAPLIGLGQGAWDDWIEAPRLPKTIAAEDAVPLPPSIHAVPLAEHEWQCTFRYRPDPAAARVALVGSFNDWKPEACPLEGPSPDGEWTATVNLRTGVHEYKFVVNGDTWRHDPLNQDRIPDGYGGYNSFVRLGRLATLDRSPATPGDGQIDGIGLAHHIPAPLYTQTLDADTVVIRYRTLAHDVRNVWLLIRGRAPIPMAPATRGPLFEYWAAEVKVPPQDNPRSPNVRSILYTFLLDDGAGRVADPHTYRYSFTSATVFDAPDWAPDAVNYQVIIDRFRNGSAENDPPRTLAWTSAWFELASWERERGLPFYDDALVFERRYGGDLQGIRAQLAYLKALGVNTLYLSPVFEAPSYHKYDVADYVHVDDDFGVTGAYEAAVAEEDLLDPSTWQWSASDQVFLDLLREAHDEGLRVIPVLVLNHVGERHPAFRDLLKNGRASRYADWFDVTSWEPLEVRGWAGFAHMPVFRKNVTGLASESLRRHLFAVTRRWMDPDGDGDPRDGVDGWCVDAPHDIPSGFWIEWRRVVKDVNPAALITAELWHRAEPWLDGQQFDATMNYEFARTAVAWIVDERTRIPVTAAAARLAELRLAYPMPATYASQSLVDNHNTDRLASMAQNPDRIFDRQNRVQDGNEEYDNTRPSETAYRKARLVALLQTTYVGTPLIYYGDEAGMWGADDPTNRKPMLWQDLEPYAEADNRVNEEHLAYYRELGALRTAHPALRRGTIETLLADDAAGVWAFVRSTPQEDVVVVLNASAAPHVVDVPLPAGLAGPWRVAFGTPDPRVEDGTMSLEVPAIGGVVLQRTAAAQ